MVYFLPFSRSELITLVTRELDFWSKMVCIRALLYQLLGGLLNSRLFCLSVKTRRGRSEALKAKPTLQTPLYRDKQKTVVEYRVFSRSILFYVLRIKRTSGVQASYRHCVWFYMRVLHLGELSSHRYRDPERENWSQVLFRLSLAWGSLVPLISENNLISLFLVCNFSWCRHWTVMISTCRGIEKC